MTHTARKDFNKEANEWDANAFRVNLAHSVADAIMREIRLSRDMTVLDFGCGTGLVTLKLQPLVKAITGADSSEGMLAVLQGKVAAQQLANVSTQWVDFEHGQHVQGSFDLVVSSMVAHHVPDTLGLFRVWQRLLVPGGQVCFADLDTEDGSFHNDNKGVFHQGFDRALLRTLLEQAGFGGIRDTTATVVRKEIEGVGLREFPIFLISATRSA